ncbi:MAG: PRC-barrel domain-containing protein [Vicinamibacterales bacterium]
MNHPLPWLRYVDAADVKAPDLLFDGMKVRNDAMETLGSVEGFIVDSASMRPYYVVVDSGGWFKSKDFLVPIGHARVDDDRDAIVVNLTKDRIDRFPGFDRDQFSRLDEDEVRRMNDTICEACRDASEVYPSPDPLSPVWGRPEFTQPDWWARSVTGFQGAGLAASTDAYIPPADYPAGKVDHITGEVQAEQLIEQERQARRARATDARDVTSDDRELVVAREHEDSPYPDGRAQPGDVIGLETGGERTHVGETAEDENKRRIDAEREASKQRD